MLRLPPEVWSQIFEYLSMKDIINLPFEIITENMSPSFARDQFGRICMTWTPQDLRLVTRVAEHPFLREHMKRLDLGIQQLGYMPKLFDKDSVPSDESRMALDALSVGQRFNLSRRIFRQQLRFQQTGLDLRVLTRILSCLPNIVKITINLLSRDIQGRSEDQQQEDWREGWSASPRLTNQSDCPLGFTARHVLGVAFKAFSRARTALEILHVHADERSAFPFDQTIAFDLAHLPKDVPFDDLSTCCHAMKRLCLLGIRPLKNEKVPASFSKNAWLTPSKHDLSGTSLALYLLLRNAFELQMLVLRVMTQSLPWVKATTIVEMPLGEIIQDNRMVHLTIVNLRGFSTRQKSFVDFLGACAETLRILSLVEVHVFRGTWISIFDCLKGRFRLHMPRIPTGINRIPRLQLTKLCGSGPELSRMYGRNVFEKTRRLSLAPLETFHAWEWLCREGTVNPYWHFQLGTCRFVQQELGPEDGEISEEFLRREHRFNPQGRELVHV